VPPAFAGFALFGNLAILTIVLADDFRPLALRRQLSLVLPFIAVQNHSCTFKGRIQDIWTIFKMTVSLL
jgi:hypothetical protein